MRHTEIKTITKYVVDGAEYASLEEAERKASLNNIKSRLNKAFHENRYDLDYDTCGVVIDNFEQVIRLFELAGYEFKY